jgi:hypothetical protein
LRTGRHPNGHLQAAWKIYGEDAFEFIWIVDVPEDLLLVFEKKLLEGNEDGYNIARLPTAFAKGIKWSEERKTKASLACTGRKHSAETRKKIGDVQRGKPKGPPSAEHRANLSKALKGRKCPWMKNRIVSLETRQKMRDANLGNKNFLGKKHTEETKKKISAAIKGHKMSDEQRRSISERQIGRVQSAEEKAKRAASLRRFHQRRRELQGS